MFISALGEAQTTVWDNADVKQSYDYCDDCDYCDSRTERHIRTVLVIVPSVHELDLFLRYGGVWAGLNIADTLVTRYITASAATKVDPVKKNKEKEAMVRTISKVLEYWKTHLSSNNESALYLKALTWFQIVDDDTKSDITITRLLADLIQNVLGRAKSEVFTSELATKLVKLTKVYGFDRIGGALESIVTRSQSPSLVKFGIQFVQEMARQDLSGSSSIRDRLLNAAIECLAQNHSNDLAIRLSCLAFELKDIQLMSSLVDRFLAYYHNHKSTGDINISNCKLEDLPLHLFLEELSKSLTMQQLLRTPYHRLVVAQITQLEAIVKPGPPVFSWSMPLAKLPDFPDIEKFFHSNEQHFVFLRSVD